MKNGHRTKLAARLQNGEPPPTQDELNRMRLPESPLSAEARWICVERAQPDDPMLTFYKSCAVCARSAYAARMMGAQVMGVEPHEITVGIVDNQTTGERPCSNMKQV
jgi:hypothetical protein